MRTEELVVTAAVNQLRTGRGPIEEGRFPKGSRLYA